MLELYVERGRAGGANSGGGRAKASQKFTPIDGHHQSSLMATFPNRPPRGIVE